MNGFLRMPTKSCHPQNRGHYYYNLCLENNLPYIYDPLSKSAEHTNSTCLILYHLPTPFFLPPLSSLFFCHIDFNFQVFADSCYFLVTIILLPSSSIFLTADCSWCFIDVTATTRGFLSKNLDTENSFLPLFCSFTVLFSI